MLFFVLLFLWFLLNGNVSLELALIGILVCGSIAFFAKKFIQTQQESKKQKKCILHIFGYIAILLIEIIKSNIAVIKLILTPNMKTWQPCFIQFSSALKSERMRVILANSITLTPGTITVSLDGNEFYIHVLDSRTKHTIEQGVFVQKLKKIEEEKTNE